MRYFKHGIYIQHVDSGNYHIHFTSFTGINYSRSLSESSREDGETIIENRSFEELL